MNFLATYKGRVMFRFEGEKANFNPDSFKKWLSGHKLTQKDVNIKMWCIASFMYGMAVRVYLA